jgi:hypothetical protein
MISSGTISILFLVGRQADMGLLVLIAESVVAESHPRNGNQPGFVDMTRGNNIRIR